MPVGVCIRVSKFDVEYDVSMDLPWSLDEYVTSGIQSAPPLNVNTPMICYRPGGLGVNHISS